MLDRTEEMPPPDYEGGNHNGNGRTPGINTEDDLGIGRGQGGNWIPKFLESWERMQTESEVSLGKSNLTEREAYSQIRQQYKWDRFHLGVINKPSSLYHQRAIKRSVNGWGTYRFIDGLRAIGGFVRMQGRGKNGMGGEVGGGEEGFRPGGFDGKVMGGK